jgi:HAD superfamily hydrolase (TIGR01490 family)
VLALSIAFFDLDRTILSVNSGSLWIRRELRLGNITRAQALKAALWATLYNVGFVRLDVFLERAVASLRGVRQVDIAQRNRDFWREEVVHTIRPGAAAAIEAHRGSGDALVLLTSSSTYLSELVAQHLGFDEILCNLFEVDADVFTGRLYGDLCYGRGKVARAVACSERRGVPLEKCTFYSDSYSDMPMLLSVGMPVAVNPDVRLRFAASRRKWPIVDWQRPELPAKPRGLLT